MEEKEEIKKNQAIETEVKTEKNTHLNFFSTNWKYNIVSDKNAPELYSRRVIYLFSVLFTVITGGILLSLNLKKINRKNAIWTVLGYSVVYTAITGTILYQFERNTFLTLIVSMLGSFALYNYFWEKYIGAETKYQTKSIWIPLIIALAIFSLFLWAIIATGSY